MNFREAIENSNLDNVNISIKSGVDVNEKFSDGDTPLVLAVIAGNCAVVEKLLLSGAKAEAKGSDKITPLRYALERRDFAVSKLLIEHGANVNSSDRKGTILTEAIVWGDPMIIKLIFDRNPDINSRSKSGITPLSQAVRYGRLDIARKLIEMGAGLSEDLLWNAISSGSTEMFKYLIDLGLDINVPRSSDGSNVLMSAIFMENIEMAILLVDLGVDLEAKNNAGETALDCANRENNKILAEYILLTESDNFKKG
jgi:ankyrin repeat protein